MPYTNTQEESHLDDFTSVSTWLGLSTTTPTKVGGNITEPVGGGYALIEIPAGSWGAAGATLVGAVKNSVALAFATATADWSEVTHAVLYDDASKTTTLGYGALTTAKTVLTDQYLSVPIGNLTIKFAQA